METLQQLLDYGAIACFWTLIMMFAHHLGQCWQHTAPQPAAQQDSVSNADLSPEMSIAAVEPELEPAIANLADEPMEVDEMTELLSIPETPREPEMTDVSLIAWAKLHSIPGASKWSNSRKLRATERHKVLTALAAA